MPRKETRDIFVYLTEKNWHYFKIYIYTEVEQIHYINVLGTNNYTVREEKNTNSKKLSKNSLILVLN